MGYYVEAEWSTDMDLPSGSDDFGGLNDLLSCSLAGFFNAFQPLFRLDVAHADLWWLGV